MPKRQCFRIMSSSEHCHATLRWIRLQDEPRVRSLSFLSCSLQEMEPPAKRARHGEVSSSAVDEALDSCSGHGRLVTTCHHAMLRTERERFDQRFVARHGSIAPAPTKKYVKHQAFKKKLSNMCPQVRSTGIGHKTSSFSRPRCLRQGLHCTQEGPQSLHVVCSPPKQVSIFCRK